jgi:hypothetical protein
MHAPVANAKMEHGEAHSIDLSTSKWDAMDRAERLRSEGYVDTRMRKWELRVRVRSRTVRVEGIPLKVWACVARLHDPNNLNGSQ